MDKSSRNIVKFIATITLAALLIMAARYYAISREVQAPPVAEEAAPKTVLPVESSNLEQAANPEEATEGEIIEEDYEIKMGEPSINIGSEAPPVQTPLPSPTPEAAPVTEPEPDPAN